MKKISAEDYFDLVIKGFKKVAISETEDTTIIFERMVKAAWMNGIRFNSYITTADNLDKGLLTTYINKCRTLTRNRRNVYAEAIVCNAVIICENVTQDAIDMAISRPRVNIMMDVFPVIVDLKRGEVYYYNGPIFFRILYNRFEREYIAEHFTTPLQTLKSMPLSE